MVILCDIMKFIAHYNEIADRHNRDNEKKTMIGNDYFEWNSHFEDKLCSCTSLRLVQGLQPMPTDLSASDLHTQ